MSSDILVQQDGVVLRITLNRPEAGNSVSNEMAAELTGLLDDVPQATRLVVLDGAGEDFCVGRARMGKTPATRPEALERRRQTDVIFTCYGAFRRARVPIVSVVQGRALGFGCALAALSDITIASETASFQIPEMAHGIMPTMVLSSLIDRVPRKALNYLVYTASTISADRALAFGIVSDVVPTAILSETVEAVCAAIAEAPAPATEAVKEYLRSAMTMDTQGAVDFARNLHATINSSSEMQK